MIYPISLIDDYGNGGINPRMYYAQIDVIDDYGFLVRVNLAKRTK